jgi:hypothetical protein
VHHGSLLLPDPLVGVETDALTTRDKRKQNI